MLSNLLALESWLEKKANTKSAAQLAYDTYFSELFDGLSVCLTDYLLGYTTVHQMLKQSDPFTVPDDLDEVVDYIQRIRIKHLKDRVYINRIARRVGELYTYDPVYREISIWLFQCAHLFEDHFGHSQYTHITIILKAIRGREKEDHNQNRIDWCRHSLYNLLPMIELTCEQFERNIKFLAEYQADIKLILNRE